MVTTEGNKMKRFKGTPGPWINVGGWVDAEKRNCELSSIICSISAVATRNPESVNDANAQLIAAAPELLEALIKLVDIVDDMVHGPSTDAAHAAINKALGE